LARNDFLFSAGWQVLMPALLPKVSCANVTRRRILCRSAAIQGFRSDESASLFRGLIGPTHPSVSWLTPSVPTLILTPSVW